MMVLSLVVAAPPGCETEDFMAALASDGFLGAEDIEIIVVGADPAEPTSHLANVTFHRVLAPASIFALWGAGIGRTSAPAIALMDVRCPPMSGWLNAVRSHLPLSRPAMFGPVASGVESADPDIVGYIVEYAQFAPPLSPTLSETPGLNLILTRDVALDPRVLRADGFVKTRLLAALAQDTSPKPSAIDGAIVHYTKRYSFASYCRHRFRHARCYAAERPLPPALRLCAALAAPALPFLRAWRIMQNVKSRSELSQAATRFAHRILLAEAAWAFGEAAGYLLGTGRTARLLS